MRAANDSTLRVLADGLIHQAEMRPKRSDSARLLRDAASALLDADMAIQSEDRPANDTASQGAAA